MGAPRSRDLLSRLFPTGWSLAHATGRGGPVSNQVEVLVPVLLVDAVFVACLMVQATVIVGGHGYLERTTGITYAEYVHQGFGQLTVATILTLLVVWAAARKAPVATSADRTWLRGSLGLLDRKSTRLNSSH